MNQEQFAQDLIRTLDAGTRELDAATLAQLHAFRRAATAEADTHHAARGALVWVRHHPWLPAGLAAGLLMLGWLAYQRPQAPDNSDVDILLLTEGIPPQAFADWSLVQQDHMGQQCLAAN